MRKLLLIILQFLIATSGFGQSLDRLRDRAEKLLALRRAGDKARAVQYIDSKNRQEFMESRPYPLLDVRILGLEFGADPKIVSVVFYSTMMVPQVGAVSRTAREPWVWDGKDWFLRIEDVGNPFTATKNQPAAPAFKPPDFELATQTVDFGKHVQGETLKTTIDFKGTKDGITGIRSVDQPGLALATDWISNDSGKIELTLDTVLLSESVNYKTELHIVDLAQQVTRIPLTVKAEIEPRLKFSQSPEILDPKQSGSTEVRIENVSQLAFELTSAVPTNGAFRIRDYTHGTIASGQTLKIVLDYDAQRQPIGAALNLELSTPVVVRTEFSLPLNIKLESSAIPAYSKEQLDELIRKSKQ